MNTRFIPENSQAITKEGIPAIVYNYTDRRGYPSSIAYIGKSNKHAFHYSFPKGETQRESRINEFFQNLEARENAKAEQKAVKKSFRHTLKVGDILYASWGYEQTNIDFYQITAITEKTVTFGEIAQTRVRGSHDSGTCAPVKDDFINEKRYTRPVKQCGNDDTKGMVKFAEHEGGMMRRLYFSDRPSHYFSDGY